MKKSRKSTNLYLLYILIIIVIFAFISLIRGIYPFGKLSLVKMDFAAQYYPMLIELYNRLYEGKSLIFSFNDSLGMPLIRNSINYLYSPFNLLFFVIKDHMLAIHMIVYLKISTIGLTTLYYLKNKFKSNDILLLIPALCFSLCGWISSYYLNIMWIDALIFIPLITLGIENLINKKKYKLYIFSLAALISINYYMGYMLCIYSAIYFFFYNIYKIKEGSIKYKINELSRNFIYFMCASLIAVILSSVVLLPMMNISSSLNGKIDFPLNLYKFNIIDFISANMAACSPTLLRPYDTNTPNIYSGLISVIFFVPFIFNKNIKRNTKVIYSLLLLFIILIMCIDVFDYIMNVFHEPAGFPYRYSFIYSFILITILSYQLLNIDKTKYKEVLLSIATVFIMILFIYIFKSEKITDTNLIITIIFSVLYLISILLIKHKLFKYILIVLTISELVITFMVAIEKNLTIEGLKKYYDSEYSKNIQKPSENEFYRSDTIYDANTLPLVESYYSISSFTSMNYNNVYYFMNNIGAKTDRSANISYASGSLLSEILLGIKEIQYKDRVKENKYYLPIMYAIGNKQDKELEMVYNSFNSSNDIIKSLTNIDNFYVENSYKSKSVIYEDDNYIVFKYKYPDNTSVNVDYSAIPFVISGDIKYTVYTTKIDDKIKADEMIKSKYPFMLYAENNELIVCYLKSDINEEYIKSYSYDEKKLKELYDYLNRYPISLSVFNEDYIEGTINVDKDMSMMSSIPYDKGWHVYIDDKEVDTYGQYDALLGFNIPQGEHNIKLKYRIPYLKTGAIISLITLVSIISFDLIKKHKKNKA